MKNILSILTIILSVSAYAGDTTEANKEKLPYYIETCTDVMADKSYAFGSKMLMCSDDGKVGFIVRLRWKIDKDKLEYSGLSVVSAGIGTCNEKDELIILFEDDTKITLKSWQDFNCKGDSHFDLYHKNFDDFNTKKVKAIRFTNGRSHDSFTYKPKEADKTFFMEAKEALENKRIVVNQKLCE